MTPNSSRWGIRDHGRAPPLTYRDDWMLLVFIIAAGLLVGYGFGAAVRLAHRWLI